MLPRRQVALADQDGDEVVRSRCHVECPCYIGEEQFPAAGAAIALSIIGTCTVDPGRLKATAYSVPATSAGPAKVAVSVASLLVATAASGTVRAASTSAGLCDGFRR